MLLEQRQTVEARDRDHDLKVVAAAGSVLDGELGCVRKRLLEQAPKNLHGHLQVPEFPRWWARYSSRSERVITPTGRPSRATTTAFVRPVSVGKTSSSDSPASIVARGGCIAFATSSWSASGFLKTRSSRSRSCSEPTTSARDSESPSRTTGSWEIE